MESIPEDKFQDQPDITSEHDVPSDVTERMEQEVLSAAHEPEEEPEPSTGVAINCKYSFFWASNKFPYCYSCCRLPPCQMEK